MVVPVSLDPEMPEDDRTLLGGPDFSEELAAGMERLSNDADDAAGQAWQPPEVPMPTVSTPQVPAGMADDLIVEPISNGPAVDRPISDGPAVDRSVLGGPAVGRPVLDGPAVDRPVLDGPAVDRPVLDEPAVDRPVLGAPIVDKAVVDVVSAPLGPAMGDASSMSLQLPIVVEEPVSSEHHILPAESQQLPPVVDVSSAPLRPSSMVDPSSEPLDGRQTVIATFDELQAARVASAPAPATAAEVTQLDLSQALKAVRDLSGVAAEVPRPPSVARSAGKRHDLPEVVDPASAAHAPTVDGNASPEQRAEALSQQVGRVTGVHARIDPTLGQSEGGFDPSVDEGPASFGGFELQYLIARGRRAAVYRAIHVATGREVALKILLAPGRTAAAFVSARGDALVAAARLEHERIIRVLDVGHVDDRYYVALEYAPGWALDDKLAVEGLLPLPDALQICTDVTAALAEAEVEGILHADLRPSHVMVDDEGRAQLTGFGFYHVYQRRIGTPGFMAPEVVAGGSPTLASDRYALGVLLFRVLVGRMPY
ncbi:MAG: serine/threonine-protein kinase, partial [Myxococcota bacterium]